MINGNQTVLFCILAHSAFPPRYKRREVQPVAPHALRPAPLFLRRFSADLAAVELGLNPSPYQSAPRPQGCSSRTPARIHSNGGTPARRPALV